MIYIFYPLFDITNAPRNVRHDALGIIFSAAEPVLFINTKHPQASKLKSRLTEKNHSIQFVRENMFSSYFSTLLYKSVMPKCIQPLFTQPISTITGMKFTVRVDSDCTTSRCKNINSIFLYSEQKLRIIHVVAKFRLVARNEFIPS